MAKRVCDNMDIETYEIIVVDDGSDDNSGNIARECGVRVIANPHNVGYGRSLKNGILAAKFDTIVIADCDGTYPFETLPLLLKKYEENFDLVVGQRMGAYYWESWYKNVLRKILKFLVEFATGTKIADINSGFRVFSKKTIVTYFDNLCDVFSFTTTMTLGYILTKRYICYVPIDYQKRTGKTKVRLVRDTLGTLQYIVESIAFYNPVKIFLILSFLVVLFSIIVILFGVLYGQVILIGAGLVGWVFAVAIFSLGLISYLIASRN
jgi:glycosyltransferase involved in cell wall biosynthesis